MRWDFVPGLLAELKAPTKAGSKGKVGQSPYVGREAALCSVLFS